MTIFGSRKINFYKSLRLTSLLSRSLSDKNNWVRYHAVLALKEIGNRRALISLRKLLSENNTGYWIEDTFQTMQELSPHYPGGDEIIDAINNFNREWDSNLRKEVKAAIVKIESKYYS